jgi:RNA polymerase sigma factor (sigma-70 family)
VETYVTAAKQTTTRGELAESALKTHRARVDAFFRRYWRRPEDLDDMAQELYLKLRGRDPHLVVRYPLTYLYRAAFSVLVNWANRERRRRDHVEANSEAVEDWANNLDNAQPDDMAERLNNKRQIERNLQKLPRQIAQVMGLHCREWTNEQIARHLGLDEDTVAKYILRGTDRMTRLRWDI